MGVGVGISVGGTEGAVCVNVGEDVLVRSGVNVGEKVKVGNMVGVDVV
jgi:hypothetical protein